MADPQKLSRLIKKMSSELGFELCGISPARYLTEHDSRLRSWLKSGLHGEMEFMTRNHNKRVDPTVLVEGAKSVITVALNYYQQPTISDDSPLFSIYAYGDDYHKVLKDKLYKLFDYIKSLSDSVTGRVFVDSAPVLERAWAVESGVGWIGKNCMLINRVFGSYVFLGELILDVELNYDKPETMDHCGTCTKCVDACPTGAILKGRILDASKCISYLSIEKRGPFETDKVITLNGNVFGCDICQDVCPWNSKAKITKEKAFTIRKEIGNFTKHDWENTPEEDFNSIFRDSPVLRTGYAGFKRNLDALQ